MVTDLTPNADISYESKRYRMSVCGVELFVFTSLPVPVHHTKPNECHSDICIRCPH